MTGPPVQFVEKLRIHSVQPPHAARKIAVGRFDKEMIVVVHQAVGVADPVVALVDVPDGVQEIDPVLIAFEDSLFFITSRGNVVDSAGALYS